MYGKILTSLRVGRVINATSHNLDRIPKLRNSIFAEDLKSLLSSNMLPGCTYDFSVRHTFMAFVPIDVKSFGYNVVFVGVGNRTCDYCKAIMKCDYSTNIGIDPTKPFLVFRPISLRIRNRGALSNRKVLVYTLQYIFVDISHCCWYISDDKFIFYNDKSRLLVEKNEEGKFYLKLI